MFHNDSSSSSDSDEETATQKFQINQYKSRLLQIEKTLRIATPPSNDPNRHVPHRSNHRRNIMNTEDRSAIQSLVERYKLADRRRASVAVEKRTMSDNLSDQKRKELLASICLKYAKARFLHFTAPTMLNDVKFAMGGTSIDTRTTLYDPTNAMTCTRTLLFTKERNRNTSSTSAIKNSFRAKKNNSNKNQTNRQHSKTMNRYGGLHAGAAETNFLISLTSKGYLQYWAPCVTKPTTRFNDPFRNNDQSDPNLKKHTNAIHIDHVVLNDMSYQGFVEIDSALDWNEDDRKAEQKEERKNSELNHIGNEKIQDDNDKDKNASLSSSSSSSSEESESETDSETRSNFARDVILTGCFVGPGVPWWKSQKNQQNQNPVSIESPDQSSDQSAITMEQDSIAGVVHHVFVVGSKTGRLSLHRVTIRARKRHDQKGQNATEASMHLQHSLPSSGLNLDDTTSIQCQTIATRPCK